MRPHSHIRHLSSLAILACAGLLTAAEPAPQSIPSAPILTPAAPATPRVNGPGIFGVRPGAPFLYSIPATGQRPMTFAVDGLPAGLTLDAATGKQLGKTVFPFRKMDDPSPDGKGALYAPARYDNLLLKLDSRTLKERQRWTIDCVQVVAVEYCQQTEVVW